MKPSKFIRPNECLTVAEIYRRQFGGTTTPRELWGLYASYSFARPSNLCGLYVNAL